jgi:phenylalanyl-tRNA synthetase beta chain
MKISLNWLKTLIPLTQTPEEIEAILTATGLEVEHYEYVDSIKGGLRGLVVGEVKTCVKHPNADKLNLTTVDIGQDTLLNIVCGAPNVSAGIKVIVAPVGTLITPSAGEPFTIQKAKIRGEQSEGMLCAEDEIGLGASHAGLLILPENLELGSKLSDYFKVESDVVFEIGLTANRGDAASHLGVARELSTVLDIPLQIKTNESAPSSNSKAIQIEIEDNKTCPRYSGIILENIRVKESPDWLKTRLNSIGLRPINNIVDVTNFVLHELGQPLHAFDFDKIKGQKITVKRNNKEKFTTLDGVERNLHGHELMVYNSEEAMCMAGVYGGAFSGVTEDTKTIFIESAYFSPDAVRKAAKQHALNTDSSFRFERGTDPEMCIPAILRASNLLIELAGANVASQVYDVYPSVLEPFKIELRIEKIKQITGIDIPDTKIESILTGLGIKIISKDNKAFQLDVPRFKGDVTREIDVVEELIRIYGFEHIPLQRNLQVSLNYKSDNRQRKGEVKIAELLKANGFMEIMNNSLSSDKLYEDKSGLVYLSNPLSAEMNVMRSSMLYGALESIAYNKNRKQSNTHFFEFGKIYSNKEKGFKEQDQLIIIASGNKTNESWENKSAAVDYYFIKSICEKTIDLFGVKSFEYNIEEVEANLLQKFGIKDKVFFAVLDWAKLLKQKKEFVLQPIPQFPIVRRDLSLVLSKDIYFEKVQNIVNKKGGPKIVECNVFDIYEGKPLEANQKAMSISIELYDNEKTMSDSDIDPIMSTLISAFETELNAIIRK